MSVFKQIPCVDEQGVSCPEYTKCEQFKCDAFRNWFNEVYIKVMEIEAVATIHGSAEVSRDGTIKGCYYEDDREN